jgi:pimeloyl-ACP methyl ester carboxylesterase
MTTTFVLIPGADGRAWTWQRLVPRLRALGHEAVAVDYPADPRAGLAAYADAAVAALRASAPASGPERVVVVGLSLGGFVAPLVCERVPVDLLVLLNAMVPTPGESVDAWWGAVGHGEARAAAAAQAGRVATGGDAFDLRDEFFHDVPDEITDEALAGPPPAGPSAVMCAQPWPLAGWPDVPTRFLQGSDDRFFPPSFQRRVVRDRLGPGVEVDELPGGHLLPLSQPGLLAGRLDAYLRALTPAG